MPEHSFEPPHRLALDAYDEEPKTLEELREELAAELAAEDAARFFTADLLSALYRHGELLVAHLEGVTETRKMDGLSLDGEEKAALQLLRLLLGSTEERAALGRLAAIVRQF